MRRLGSEVREKLKQERVEVLDVPAGKRFDTDGRSFWNLNIRED